MVVGWYIVVISRDSPRRLALLSYNVSRPLFLTGYTLPPGTPPLPRLPFQDVAARAPPRGRHC